MFNTAISVNLLSELTGNSIISGSWSYNAGWKDSSASYTAQYYLPKWGIF